MRDTSRITTPEEFKTSLARIITRTAEKTRNDEPFKAAIDSTYTTGDPVVILPGEESGASTDTKKVWIPYSNTAPRAGDEVICVPIGNDIAVAGKLASISGTPDSGAYKLLPTAFPTAVFTTPTVTANQTRVWRFELALQLIVTNVVFEIVTGASGQFMAIGVYSSDGGTKLIDTGAFSTSANGVHSKVITAVTLLPGWYCLAWTIDNTTATLRSTANSANFGINNNTVVQKGSAANASSAGVLPATLGALTTGVFDVPIVKLQG